MSVVVDLEPVLVDLDANEFDQQWWMAGTTAIFDQYDLECLPAANEQMFENLYPSM